MHSPEHQQSIMHQRTLYLHTDTVHSTKCFYSQCVLLFVFAVLCLSTSAPQTWNTFRLTEQHTGCVNVHYSLHYFFYYLWALQQMQFIMEKNGSLSFSHFWGVHWQVRGIFGYVNYITLVKGILHNTATSMKGSSWGKPNFLFYSRSFQQSVPYQNKSFTAELSCTLRTKTLKIDFVWK